MPLTRSAALLILQAGRRLIEVPPLLLAKARELGREAGKTAAGWVLDQNTPGEACQRVLRGIEDGTPLSSTRPGRPRSAPPSAAPPATSPATSASNQKTAPRAVSAYADGFSSALWQETERAARGHLGYNRARPASITRPGNHETR